MMNFAVGKLTARDIFNLNGTLLIAKGTLLNNEHQELLAKHNVVLTSSDIADGPFPDGHNEKLISSASAEILNIFKTIRTSQEVPLDTIQDQIMPSIFHVAESPSLANILSGLQAKDDYTYRHNIGVAVYTNMIGRWLHVGEQDLAELTMAATLHDVGKIKITDDILNKPGKFTDEEFGQMKRHAAFGYEILKQSKGISDRIALVALQHHERENGTGYPGGIQGEDMDYFSKIVAVADIFHALSTNRVYRQSMPFHKVIEIMREEGFGMLNSPICSLFVQRIMEMTVGNDVRLTDGRIGKVVHIDPVRPERPLVRIDNAYIDLNRVSDLHIQTIIGSEF